MKAVLFFLMLVTPVLLCAQLTGNISVKTKQPDVFIHDIHAGIYPGEKATFHISSQINVNPKKKKRRECTEFFGFQLKCKTIRWTDNNWETPSKYPAEIVLFNKSDDQEPVSSELSNNISLSVPSTYLNFFLASYQPRGYIPARGEIKRGTSYGSYRVTMKVDSRGRLNRLKDFLYYLLETDDFRASTVNKAINKRLREQYPVKIAEIILDFINEHESQHPGLKTDFKKLALLASKDLAPNNPGLKIKLADYFLSDLQFQQAKDTLLRSIKLIKRKRNNAQLSYKELDQIGEAYALLGYAFANENLGIEKTDLIQAERYYGQAIEYYEKAVNFNQVINSVHSRINVLKKISTKNSLSQAVATMKKYKALYMQLLPFKENGKFGFINSSKQVVIPNIYEDAYTFDTKTKLAAVKKNGKWGVISQTGTTIIDFSFDSPVIFSRELVAPYFKDNKMGFVDRIGHKITSTDYMSLVQLVRESNNVEKGLVGGMHVLTMNSAFIPVVQEKQNSNDFVHSPIPDELGEIVLYNPIHDTKIKFGDLDSHPLQSHYSFNIVNGNIIAINQNKKWGVMDAQGNILLPFEYSFLDVVGMNNRTIRALGGINFESILNVNEDESLFFFRKGNKSGIINLKGEKIYETIVPSNWPPNSIYLDFQGNFLSQSGDKAIFVEFTKNGKNKIVLLENTKKKNLIPEKGPQDLIIQNGHLLVKNNNNWDVYSDFGINKHFSVECEKLFYFAPYFFVAKRKDKFAFVGTDGKYRTDYIFEDINNAINNPPLINTQPPNYLGFKDNFPIYPVKIGLVSFVENGLTGFMDLNGEKIIEAKFDNSAFAIGNLFYIIEKDGSYTFYNREEELLFSQKSIPDKQLGVELEYPLDLIRITAVDKKIFDQFEGSVPFHAKQALKIYDPKHGQFINPESFLPLPLFKTLNSSGSKCGAYNLDNGEYMLEPIYDSIEYFPKLPYINPVLFKVKKDGKWGIVSNTNQTIIPIEYDNLEFLLSCMPVKWLFNKNFNFSSTDEFDGVSNLELNAIPKSLLLELVSGFFKEEIGNALWFVKDNKVGYLSLKGETLWEYQLE